MYFSKETLKSDRVSYLLAPANDVLFSEKNEKKKNKIKGLPKVFANFLHKIQFHSLLVSGIQLR